ncbi:DegT/DnrJ/EryC1/StrS aminotransferase family protein [Sphingomonas sp. SM33]|uniref:DegT/DnrJ/EryC1/StrS aminotransferase family protein n=1 Tax=Sphingomonas telluris TaxID=2907998 RepID=A0ABS9VLM3_9SPHN|nr:DegT/DnrJ/EryC1/StrS aminotransferase family protein [Sphingomonas telluris]MCH8615865.1 DegT/DnrJ/EryC1/StrS aminotransferase family protein [Sphingomonas telluris]
MSSAPKELGAMEDLRLRPDEAWPAFEEDEIEAAGAVLRSGKVNQWTGPDVSAFERACTERFGGCHGVAVANGSVALELALRALGIESKDEVIVTPRSFVASAFCVMLVGAKPMFADVEPASGNISAETVERVLTPRTKAIIPVHLAGWPADMPAIMELAGRHGVKVIEDCAQSPGATVDGRPAGSFGDAAAFSFCQDKIITTGGEGGFVSFRDADAHERAWAFKDHGKNRAKALAPPDNPGQFRWLHDSVGTNWRLTGPQAAIGLAQLGKLDAWLKTRARNAQIWIDALSETRGISMPLPREGMRHAFYKLYFQLEPGTGTSARTEILRRSAAEGIRVFSGSCSEIYRELAFNGMPTPNCPTAQRLSETSLMVEVHPTLRPDLIMRRAQRLAQIISDVLSESAAKDH